jgi:hypothetical protein
MSTLAQVYKFYDDYLIVTDPAELQHSKQNFSVAFA